MFLALVAFFTAVGDVDSTTMLLDLVEVPRSHTSDNLAAAIAKVLGDYKISDKVSLIEPLQLQSHMWLPY